MPGGREDLPIHEVHPLSAILTFRFPERESLPPVNLTWYEGTQPLTETCKLGNIAKRADGPIEWDVTNLKVKNSEVA